MFEIKLYIIECINTIITAMILKQLVVFFILINSIQLIICTDTDQNFYRYLQQYGYTPKVEGRRLFSILDKSSYNEGVKTFQRLYKLKVYN